MSDEFDENVASLFQKSLPIVTSVLVMLLGYIPVDIALFDNVRSDLGLVCIYFWMLHRPDLFGITAIVILGAIVAVVSSSLPGSSFFAYLLMYVLVYNTQKYFYAKPFVVVWYGFIALAFVDIMAKWLVVSIFYRQSFSLSITIFGFLLAAALYPVVSVVLALLVF